MKSAEVDVIKDSAEFEFPMIEQMSDQLGGRPPCTRRKRKTPALEYIPIEEQGNIFGDHSDPLSDATASADRDLVAEDEEPDTEILREGTDDYWTMTQDAVIRHHVTPRVHLYHPTKMDFPIPLKYIGVTRLTVTDLKRITTSAYQ